MTVSFIESGSDATQGLEFYGSVTGAAASSTAQAHTGPRSIHIPNPTGGVNNFLYTPEGTISDAGTRFSFWLYLVSAPSGALIWNIVPKTAGFGGGANCFIISMNTSRKLDLYNTFASLVQAGTTVIPTGSWTHVEVDYIITSGSVNQVWVYINGTLDYTSSNFSCSTTSSNMQIGIFNTSTGGEFYLDDVVIDNGSTGGTMGVVVCTAKRPNANGTTNSFTGTGGGSGYGSGNSVYVNERPQSDSSFVSVVAAGVTVEEYNIENLSTGDVDLTGATIIDSIAWVRAKALLSETASLRVNNSDSNIALTSTTTFFTKIVGSSTYAAGIGTDLGIVTTALATTVTMYEIGEVYAYIPGAVATVPSQPNMISQMAAQANW